MVSEATLPTSAAAGYTGWARGIFTSVLKTKTIHFKVILFKIATYEVRNTKMNHSLYNFKPIQIEKLYFYDYYILKQLHNKIQYLLLRVI